MMMKFTCNTTALTQGINSALLAVSPKSTLLALEGIMVQAGFREISLVSYNLEMGITASLEAQVEQMGQIIIPAKMFYDIIRRIESDEVTIEADDRCLVQITGGVSQFTILGMTAEEFPELPEVGEAAGFTMPMETLSSMVDMTRYAIATNDTKPVQTGCLFELENGELTVVAVDGFRLALRREQVQSEETMRFIVPGKTLGELLKLNPGQPPFGGRLPRLSCGHPEGEQHHRGGEYPRPHQFHRAHQPAHQRPAAQPSAGGFRRVGHQDELRHQHRQGL